MSTKDELAKTWRIADIEVQEVAYVQRRVIAPDGRSWPVVAQDWWLKELQDQAAEIARLQRDSEALAVAKDWLARTACYACSQDYPLNKEGTHHSHEGRTNACSRFSPSSQAGQVLSRIRDLQGADAQKEG